MDNIAGADRLSVSRAYIIASVPQFAIIEGPSVTSITESLQIGSRVSLSFIVGGGAMWEGGMAWHQQIDDDVIKCEAIEIVSPFIKQIAYLLWVNWPSANTDFD